VELKKIHSSPSFRHSLLIQYINVCWSLLLHQVQLINWYRVPKISETSKR